MNGYVILLALAVGVVHGAPKCAKDSHGILRYNGKPCASTTRYDDGHRGACGCGPPNSDQPFAWNLADFVTAPNQKYFDNGGDKQWCGGNCGKCVKLTPTGGFVPGLGQAPRDTSAHIFLVTNDCPINDNREWCGQSGKPGTNGRLYSRLTQSGTNRCYAPVSKNDCNPKRDVHYQHQKCCRKDQANTHGYEVHFDLQNNKAQISSRLGWDNPEVTWEEVACPGDVTSKWHQCECFHSGTDEIRQKCSIKKTDQR